MHGLRGSLAAPDPVSAGLGNIRLPSLVLCYDIVTISPHLAFAVPHFTSSCSLVLALFLLPITFYPVITPLRPSPTATMDQPSEPNAAAMHNVQRRRGSVGTSQLFDNIVSTSNCTSDHLEDT